MPEKFATITAEDWRKSLDWVRKEKERIKPEIEKIMSDVEDSEPVSVYQTQERTAAKDHTCEETGLPIRKGEKYRYVSWVGEGAGDYKVCNLFYTWYALFTREMSEAKAARKWDVPKGSNLPFWPPDKFLMGEALIGIAAYLRENAEEPAGTAWLDFTREMYDSLMHATDRRQMGDMAPTELAVGLLCSTSWRKRAGRPWEGHQLIYEDVPGPTGQPSRLYRAYRWKTGQCGVSVTPTEHPLDPETFGEPLLKWSEGSIGCNIEPGWADGLARDRSVPAHWVLGIGRALMDGIGNYKTITWK